MGAQQREQLDILAQDLARLDDEIVKIQQNVDKYQARTAAQKRERQRILVEVDTLKRQHSVLRQSSQIAASEKQEKIAKLQRDIDALLAITVHLAAQ
jgi:chromosome segregation ATPase